jgi:hypothetical protein
VLSLPPGGLVTKRISKAFSHAKSQGHLLRAIDFLLTGAM